MKRYSEEERWLLIPVLGILLFIVLYFVATLYYPGGSTASPTHEGFDWINNYWCDLIARHAKNGEPNTARTIALIAMIILFSSLAVFWFYLPRLFHERKFMTLLIRYTGSISMFILIFVFTRFHDSVIGIGSTISAIPMAATLTELYRHKFTRLYYLGWGCILLILLNFAIYITEWWIIALPFIQKITLVLFLSWIFLTDLSCLRMIRSKKRKSPMIHLYNKSI